MLEDGLFDIDEENDEFIMETPYKYTKTKSKKKEAKFVNAAIPFRNYQRKSNTFVETMEIENKVQKIAYS